MQRNILKFTILSLILTTSLSGGAIATHAAHDYEVSGWIPYWRSAEGAKDAEKHIRDLDVVHPFGYTVSSDGKLIDTAKLGSKTWKDLFETARDKDVEIIPSILWTNGQQIEEILGSKKSRTKHIKEIVSAVKKGKFDGIDIDYEQKLAQTQDDFSLFLKELKKELGKKTLVCTIEARTPPSSLYRVVPETLEYANDYNKIGRYCDRVQLMMYDQGRADFRLNDEKSGSPYIPVADADWVRKVAELAVQDIPRSKIMLGVPTYGREYQVTVSPNWFQSYQVIRSVNQPAALDVAKAYGITPSRNKAGEISFSYPTVALPELSIPANTPSGDVIAQRALAYANQTGLSTTFNVVWWSDAKALEHKLDIVDDLNLRGIAIFKIDGEEDRKIWNIID